MSFFVFLSFFPSSSSAGFLNRYDGAGRAELLEIFYFLFFDLEKISYWVLGPQYIRVVGKGQVGALVAVSAGKCLILSEVCWERSCTHLLLFPGSLYTESTLHTWLNPRPWRIAHHHHHRHTTAAAHLPALPSSPPPAHSVPTTRVPSLFCLPARNYLAPGPLHLLFPLSGRTSPHSSHSWLFFLFQLNATSSQRPTLTTHS